MARHGMTRRGTIQNRSVKMNVMSTAHRPGSLRTIYTALYLGWGVVPLMFAVTLMQGPAPTHWVTVLFIIVAAAWWVCGLGMAGGFRWASWPAMGIVWVAWAAISVEMLKAARLLLSDTGGGAASGDSAAGGAGGVGGVAAGLTWDDIAYRAVFFLLPLTALLVLGWLTRPRSHTAQRPRPSQGPEIGRLM